MSSPFLIGKKTNLRPVLKSDAETLNKWINNPETRRYMLARFPISIQTENEWIERINKFETTPTDITLIVETKDGQPLGTMGLHRISWVHRNAVTGTMIGDRELRGQGYATDAKMTLLKYAFESLGMHKISSHAFKDNKASIAYSKKCGYVEEAVLKDDHFYDMKWHDTVVLACFYETWKRVAKRMKYA